MTGRFSALDADDPDRVGGYALRARIGAGGMGRVYLAFTPGGRPLAVKVVRPDYAHDPEFRRRFTREIKAARSVMGLYTAPVVDADSDASLPWLATAYVPGPSLAQAVAEHGPLPLPTVFRLIAGVAEGLMAVHACELVHRDLKPANILLADDGPRVIDFGIAHAASATAATVTGLRIGTPAYMAPEQVRGRSAGPPADVFALGNLALYAATGRAAFGEGNNEALFYRILHEEPELDTCPKPLRGLVRRCLAKDPGERPDLARIMPYAADRAGHEPSHLARGWLPAPLVGTLAAYDTARYRKPQQPKQPGKAEESREPEKHGTPATTEKHPGPRTTKKLPDGRTPPAAEKKQDSPARAAQEPEVRPRAAAGGGGEAGAKTAGVVMAALTLVVSVAILVAVAWNSDRRTHGSDGPSAVATTTEPVEPTAYEPSDEPEETEEPTPTPSSPEDEAFAAVEVDDCLSNYRDSELGWNSTTPRVSSCSDTGSYYRVVSVSDTYGDCASDDLFWDHDNGDGSETVLCLDRNYLTGQCMYATADGNSLSLYRNQVTGCQESFPDEYEYIVQITRLYPEGAPDDACADEWEWSMNNGGDYCGDWVWKRSDMPDI
ncbi:serine/threonine-protein kinase [Streptomyces sp. NPDC047974]|uniref:serine/threonine protein kinase n=1 Tax=Streptomyces sp. NPDC047974 TaxID=3154343 RepID=UPI0033D8A4B4